MMPDRRQLIQTATATAVGAACGGAIAPADDSPGQDWPVEIEVGSFYIRCDFELESQDTLVQELRRISSDLARLLQVPPPTEAVYIVLFETDAEYQRYMEKYFPRVPKRRAIFLQSRGPGMLFTHWHEEVATDLRHEVTHALLNVHGRPLPLWLDEGLAEYFEVRREARFANHPYRSEVSRLAQASQLAPLGHLSDRDDIADFSNEDYQHSWAWVHFLIHRHADTRQLLIRFLQEIRAGREPFDLERGLFQLVANPQRELREHFLALA